MTIPRSALDLYADINNYKGDWSQTDEMWRIISANWHLLKAPYAHFYGDSHIGDGVGVGWWQPVLDAFARIDEVLKDAPEYTFQVVQIKEKFGGLRFYWSLTKKDDVEEDEPTFSPDPVCDLLSEKIATIVDAAEAACASRCEVCGEPGTMRGGGWLRTLCDKHAS